MTDFFEKNRQKNTTDLFLEVKDCQLCANQLPYQPRPILQGSADANIMIIGQAPGTAAHRSSLAWNDPSGDRLRTWLGINRDTFYDVTKLAIVPMGFCYPGKSRHGDLPPLPACAPAWHSKLITYVNPEIILLVGQYAQNYYLSDKESLTERVRHWRRYLPRFIAMPHPSPRNNIWLKKNPWFEQQELPAIRNHLSPWLSTT